MPYRGRFRGVDLSALKPPEPPAIRYDPFAQPYQPIDEMGWIDRIKIDSPAAGTLNLTKVFDGTVWQQPLSFWARLQTDANAGNRSVFIEFATDEGQLIVRADTTQTVAANGDSFWQYVLGENIFGTGNTGTRIAPMPYVILEPGYSWQIRISSAKAGDQITQIAMLMRKWSNRPRRAAIAHPLSLTG